MGVKFSGLILWLMGLITLSSTRPYFYYLQQSQWPGNDDPGDRVWNDFHLACLNPGTTTGVKVYPPIKAWPDKKVIYEMDPDFTADEIGVIEGAMRHIEEKTCIRFIEKDPEGSEPDWVYILRGNQGTNCFTSTGKQNGPQKLNLQPDYGDGFNCITLQVLIHQFIHIIGFHHEVQRPDRDEYVEVNYYNVKPNRRDRFDIIPANVFNTYEVPYDYSSIMHCLATSFAVDKNKPSIVPKQDGVELGNTVMSKLDAEKINRMYECQAGEEMTRR